MGKKINKNFANEMDKKIENNNSKIINSPLLSGMKAPLPKSFSNGKKGLRNQQSLQTKYFWSKAL